MRRPPIGELFGILFTLCRWRNCAKSCTQSVFVSDVGHPCQREDVCEVAPILQSHNALQISSLGQKREGGPH